MDIKQIAYELYFSETSNYIPYDTFITDKYTDEDLMHTILKSESLISLYTADISDFYIVTITETLTKKVITRATSKEHAELLAKQAYGNYDITLDPNDNWDNTTYTVEHLTNNSDLTEYPHIEPR